ncbi:GntR family transcriptional regulator [Streptosporangium sp. NPDC020145]|uniref:GntR family transcriptional regulator n=1 Tax=Streptosporangium sp. NPDC020145 TaxID=3154694 RepID=UPI0034282AE6
MPLPQVKSARRYTSAQQFAYEELRAWILNGVLQPDETVRDVEIAEFLGVSRTPVREALIRLGQEGLVEASASRMTRVASLPLDRASHLFQVGATLDALAAELAAPHMTESDLHLMRGLLDTLNQTTAPDRLSALDEEFHRVYYRRAANPVLIETLDSIDEQLRRIERHIWGYVRVHEEAYEEHRALLEALGAGDAAGAAAAARHNWHRSWQRIDELLKPASAEAAQEPR